MCRKKYAKDKKNVHVWKKFLGHRHRRLDRSPSPNNRRTTGTPPNRTDFPTPRTRLFIWVSIPLEVVCLDFHRQCNIELPDFDGTKVRITHFSSEWVLCENVYRIVVAIITGRTRTGARGKRSYIQLDRVRNDSAAGSSSCRAFVTIAPYTHYQSSVEIRSYLRFLFFSWDVHTRERDHTTYKVHNAPLTRRYARVPNNVPAKPTWLIRSIFDFERRRTRLRVDFPSANVFARRNPQTRHGQGQGIFPGGGTAIHRILTKNATADETHRRCADLSKLYRLENNWTYSRLKTLLFA